MAPFKAVEFSKKACDLNDGAGCVQLGIYYEHGIGARKNLQKSKEFYGKGCDLKVSKACQEYAELVD